MKKMMIMTLLLALLFGASSQHFLAAEPQDATSNVSVTFEVEDPTEPVKPLDPTDPTKPLDPEDGNEGTGNIGPLTIDYAPHLTFGTHKINRQTITVESTNKQPFAQVTDVRATGAGWKLQANLSPFVNKTTTSPDITDAQITMAGATVKTNSSKTDEAPNANQNIVLTSSAADSKVDIMTAQAGKGMGTWLTTWVSTNEINEKVTLNLDTTDARVGNYEATLTWTLSQTP